MKIVILYATTTGNTEYVAKIISSALKGCDVLIKNVLDVSPGQLNGYDLLIFGTPTWGEGNAHKDWINFFRELPEDSLRGKKVALFGLGDSLMFSKQFVNGLRELYDMCVNRGAIIVGRWKTDGYRYESSNAVISGEFCGLVIDQENEGEHSVSRVNEWVKRVLEEVEEKN